MSEGTSYKSAAVADGSQPCSHQPIARVGHSTGPCRHFDLMMIDKEVTEWRNIFATRKRRVSRTN